MVEFAYVAYILPFRMEITTLKRVTTKSRGNCPNWNILVGQGKEINEIPLVKAIETGTVQTELPAKPVQDVGF